jgi:hypothetical protein
VTSAAGISGGARRSRRAYLCNAADRLIASGFRISGIPEVRALERRRLLLRRPCLQLNGIVADGAAVLVSAPRRCATADRDMHADG